MHDVAAAVMHTGKAELPSLSHCNLKLKSRASAKIYKNNTKYQVKKQKSQY